MAMVTENWIDEIGTTAGRVWHVLHEQGAMSLTKLVKQLDLPRDLVMQAIGWLAREEKVTIDDARVKNISLRDSVQTLGFDTLRRGFPRLVAGRARGRVLACLFRRASSRLPWVRDLAVLEVRLLHREGLIHGL